jgi:hypothetical protein
VLSGLDDESGELGIDVVVARNSMSCVDAVASVAVSASVVSLSGARRGKRGCVM